MPLMRNSMGIGFKIKKAVEHLVFFVLEVLYVFYGKNRPLQKSGIKKFLVAESGGIGDLIMVLPAIEALNKNFPGASVSLLASPVARGILPLFPKQGLISEVIEYDFKGRHNSLAGKLSLIMSLRRKHYDLIYSPDRGEGMREEVIMNFLTGAPRRIGFSRGKTGLLNTVHLELKDDIPILKQNLALLKAAGLKVTKENVDLHVSEECLKDARQLIETYGSDVSSLLIAVHPGGFWNGNYKCWPAENYSKLIMKLREELGASTVIIGSMDEAGIAEKILSRSVCSFVINLVGRTTLAQMAGIIKLSNLFIGNDSGPLHMASVLGVPFIGIFGPTSAAQLLPDMRRGIVVSSTLSCSPCYLHQPLFKPLCHSDENSPCMKSVSVDEVMEVVRKQYNPSVGKQARISCE
ncbi:MAG TPA: glycosyltransferase family 9 protein [Nitrospirota bacterium]|nr:glycosyltransferase family 9 protein [Nitrospirota bacterium]